MIAGAALIAAAFGLAGCGEKVEEGKDCPPAQRARTVSGFCVPRWVSLKKGQVAARKGPGKDYPVVWTYHARGLPVQVVGETEDWRRVCDPDGGAAWVFRGMIDGRRTVMTTATGPASLRAKPGEGEKLTGLLNPRALAALDHCQGGWCRVSGAGASGWTTAAGLWGVATVKQCR